MSRLPSFLPISKDCDFPLENLPFGVFSIKAENPVLDPLDEDGAVKCQARVGVAVGDYVVDLHALAVAGLFSDAQQSLPFTNLFNHPTLVPFMEAGRSIWRQVRTRLQFLLSPDSPLAASGVSHPALIPMHSVRLHLPCSIGDYTDFYASREHATNVGTMFRGAANALQPNWLHLPVGYHGRSSSVVISGAPVKRPCGQIKHPAQSDPHYGACQKLDYEIEIGCFVARGNPRGEPIPIAQAEEYLFGIVLLNDWSARDIQSWEYVPLGPFLGKNFCTTISPWVVTFDALEPFLVSGPVQDPAPLPYLKETKPSTYDITLQVTIQPKNKTESKIAETNLKYVYWSLQQQLAHHTVNGCNMRSGDLFGTGTISGNTQESLGSMLESSWNGSKPIALTESGETRTFLQDGDTVRMTGFCQGAGFRIGFGVCEGTILPAEPLQ